MIQYLVNIKSKTSTIATTGTPLSPEHIVLDTLNGLPNNY